MDGPAPETGPVDATRSQSATPLSLLEQLRANDAGGWERVLHLYGPLVRFWCRRGGLRDQDAEDVTQEVFAAAAAGFGGFRRDRPGDTFRGWLAGITRRQLLLFFRRGRGQPAADGGSDAWRQLQEVVDPTGSPDEEEAAEITRVYLRALEVVRNYFEPLTWRAFWRTAIEGVAPAELADELGMTSAAIRQAKSRVLRRLKHELGESLD
jgi:RNA polymerase sigma-70 factor (ECF subfamily)